MEGAPHLSAFGWCEGYEPHEIYILGGSDGSILQSAFYKFDLKARKAHNLGCDYPYEVALSKLAATYDKAKKSVTIHSFGGSRSSGVCYSLDLAQEQKEWQELEANYLSLFSQNDDVELQFKGALSVL